VRNAYPGGKIQELKERLQRLRLVPTALSCGGTDLEPGTPLGTIGKFRDYVAFMSSIGGYFLHMPVAGTPNRKYSAAEIKSLGSSLNELGKLAKDSGLALGYHPHLGTMGETREGLGLVLEATDPRYVGLIADVAHLALGGSDPAEVIRTYHQRLIFLHLKDARRDGYALALQNRAAARKMKYLICEIGRGMVNFPAIVATLRQVHFKGWVVVELDRNEPPPGGPAESARINKEALRHLGFNI
jgi:inosose dehydratase